MVKKESYNDISTIFIEDVIHKIMYAITGVRIAHLPTLRGYVRADNASQLGDSCPLTSEEMPVWKHVISSRRSQLI
jgi:hypothetical protein